MATNNYPRVIGDPRVTLLPLQEFLHTDNDRYLLVSDDDIALTVEIFVTLSVEDELSEDLSIATNCRMLLVELQSGAAKETVIHTLSDIHIAGEAAGSIADTILSCFADRTATWRSDKISGIESLHLMAIVYVVVDELPLTTDGNYDSDEDDIAGIDFGEHEIRFQPAKKESIEGLVKEMTEKAEMCSVCLDEAPVGSEMTRLPCSHCYHENCIVQWLERSKFCPMCRFELP